MSKISFRRMELEEAAQMLPQLFEILYDNMSVIAPTGDSFEEDRNMWLAYCVPALKEPQREMLLVYVGAVLAGYIQYRISEETLFVEEVELKREYHRTLVFYRTCLYLLGNLPETVRYVEAYVRKENTYSMALQQKLGIKRIGENRTGNSWHYRGTRDAVSAVFPGLGQSTVDTLRPKFYNRERQN